MQAFFASRRWQHCVAGDTILDLEVSHAPISGDGLARYRRKKQASVLLFVNLPWLLDDRIDRLQL